MADDLKLYRHKKTGIEAQYHPRVALVDTNLELVEPAEPEQVASLEQAEPPVAPEAVEPVAAPAPEPAPIVPAEKPLDVKAAKQTKENAK